MIQHPFKTIVFDLDGTLIDSLTGIAEAANSVLEEMGFAPHQTTKYRSFVGDGLLTLASRIVPSETPHHTVTAVAERFRTVYRDCWAAHSAPYPGIMEMLETLQQRSVNLAILSNKPDDFTQLFVDRYFPQKMFGQVLGNRPGVPTKPDPTAAAAIAEFFESEPSDCLMVGDSGVDMRTGKNCGMTSMGVSWGFRGRQELIDSGADLVVDHPSELISHVFDR